jgi:hypothetical protein
MPRETKYFTKGMNTDVEDRLLSRDQYRYALNCDFDLRDGKGGVITNEKGATLVSVTLPTGDNTVIGTKEWVEQNAVIYFTYNSLSNHSIWKYSITTNTITKILENSILGFSLDRRIHSINIFDDNLLWCDDLAPKHIVISSALAHTNGTTATKDIFPYDGLLTTGTDEEKLQFITAGPNPPLFPPTLTYSTESSNFTGIDKAIYQTSYRYVFLDNSRSTFSPMSKISNPLRDEDEDGIIPNNLNNILNIELNLGHPNVKSVEIGIKVGNAGNWQLAGVVDKYTLDNLRILGDFITYTYKWSGILGISIPDSEIAPTYWQVPINASTQSLSHDNRLFYGNYSQGYSRIDSSVVLNVESTKITTTVIGERKIVPSWRSNSKTYMNIAISFITDGQDIIFEFADNETGDTYTYTYNTYPAPGYSDSDLRTSIVAFINPLLTSDGLDTYSINASNNDYLESSGDGNIIFSIYQADGPNFKYKGWKSGSLQKLGIIYFDNKGRHGSVIPLEDVAVPFFTANQALGDIYAPVINKIVAEISHLAPDYAETYQFVVADSNIPLFIQAQGRLSATTTSSGGVITREITEVDIFDLSIKYEGYEYEYEQGDRIRFISGYTFLFGATSPSFSTFTLDSASKTITLTDPPPLYPRNFSSGIVLFEIFRPLNSEAIVYKEIGEVYEVVNGLHGGSPSQTPSTPAIVNLEGSDIYLNLMKSPLGDLVLETQFYSRFYQSKSNDFGRVQIFNKEIQNNDFTNHFIYGGRYFEDVQHNRLFEFSANNDQAVSSEDGEIRRLISVGYTIKIIQDKKISSAYLNRQIAVNPGGTDGIIISDEVVGEIRPYPQDFGSQHPESVFLNNRYLYMWDARNGVAIRDDANGPDSISKFGFNTGSKRLSETYYQGRIFGGYDETRGCILWTFGDETKNETVRYDYSDQSWRGFYEYYPENYLSLSMLFISFKNGSIWIHNNDTIKGNLYGTQNSMVMKTVFNENPTNTKTFLATAIHSNKKWSAPNQGDVKTEDTDMYGTQETRILENKFKYQDRVFYSDIPRDMKTPNVIAPVINGDKMQGSILEIQIQNNHSQEVKLFAIDVNYLNNTEI